MDPEQGPSPAPGQGIAPTTDLPPRPAAANLSITPQLEAGAVSALPGGHVDFTLIGLKGDPLDIHAENPSGADFERFGAISGVQVSAPRVSSKANLEVDIELQTESDDIYQAFTLEVSPDGIPIALTTTHDQGEEIVSPERIPL